MAPGAAVLRRRIVPAEDRSSPAQVELCVAVPAGMRSLTMSIAFQKAFLTVSEHPPDASRSAWFCAIVKFSVHGAHLFALFHCKLRCHSVSILTWQ